MVSSDLSLVLWNSEFVLKNMRSPNLNHRGKKGRRYAPTRIPQEAHFQCTGPQFGLLHECASQIITSLHIKLGNERWQSPAKFP